MGSSTARTVLTFPPSFFQKLESVDPDADGAYTANPPPVVAFATLPPPSTDFSAALLGRTSHGQDAPVYERLSHTYSQPNHRYLSNWAIVVCQKEELSTHWISLYL